MTRDELFDLLKLKEKARAYPDVFKKFYKSFEFRTELRPMVPLCEVIDYLSEKGYLRDEWQPIETAPKTCENILVYRPVHDGYYIPVIGEDYWGSYALKPEGRWMRSRQDCQPTHWMPMPNPPKEKKNDRRTKERRDEVSRKDSIVHRRA